MDKKASLRGRGAEIFLGGAWEKPDTAGNHASTPAQRHTGKMYPKATYYLPPDLQERLEDTWMEKRRSNRKLTKSEMVREALEGYLNREVL